MIGRPMLAANVTDKDLESLRFPVYVSPKLDGIRAIVTSVGVFSRSLKLIPNKQIQSYFVSSGYNRDPIDGELIVDSPTDPNCFNRTTKYVMSKDARGEFRFFAFDQLNSMPWLDRYKELPSLNDHYKVLYHNKINDHSELDYQYSDYIRLGFEGMIIRSPDGIYKHGRSTIKEQYLLKIKPYHDDEGVVIGVTPLYRNFNPAHRNELGLQTRSSKAEGKVEEPYLGALMIKSPKWDNPFFVGSGFSEDLRSKIWSNQWKYIHKIAKFKYQKIGSSLNAPRQPVFIGFRDKEDLD